MSATQTTGTETTPNIGAPERIEYRTNDNGVLIANAYLSKAETARIATLGPNDRSVTYPIPLERGTMASLRATAKGLYVVFFDADGMCRKSVRAGGDGAFETSFDGHTWRVGLIVSWDAAA